MTWGLVAVGGATIGASLISANASKSAAKTMANSNQIDRAAWKGFGNDIKDLYTPYQQTGNNALANYTAGVYNDSGPQLPNVPAIPGPQQYNQNLPIYDYAGNVPQLSYNGPGPQDFSGGRFSFSPEDLAADPSYQFRLDQGLESVNRAAGASGHRLSGNRLVALNDYAQGAASQEYQNAFGRAYQTDSTNYNRDIAENQIANANEATGYSRNRDIYSSGVNAEQQAYQRYLAGLGISSANEQQLYQRGQTAYTQKVQQIMSQFGLDYQRASDLYNAQQTKLGRLGALSDLGINSTNAIASGLSQQRQGESGAILNTAQAQAAGQLGSANAISSAIGQGANIAGQLVNNFNRPTPTPVPNNAFAVNYSPDPATSQPWSMTNPKGY